MNFAILLSGGIGHRLGSSIPKQYIECNGKPIICYSLNSLLINESIDELVVVAANEWIPLIQTISANLNSTKPIYYANPGETRQLSIFNGLRAITTRHTNITDIDLVIIHDAARPLLSEKLINLCLKIEDEYDGAMPVLPVKDTIYKSEDGLTISQLLDRSTLYAGQAPESFRLRRYFQAHEQLTLNELQKINGSSELAYRVGMRIKFVQGDPMNFKITDTKDLDNFIQIIK